MRGGFPKGFINATFSPLPFILYHFIFGQLWIGLLIVQRLTAGSE